jgi:uncharacterized Zn-binding protein involved in type VI secretion
MTMFPAARILDPITHDLTVPCGVIVPPVAGPPPNLVLIEGMPAAYVTCRCACTGAISGGLVHPPPPDPNVLPPIMTGSTTVLISGFPAARWSPAPDFGACTVMLGDPKLAAMRTVLIGG